MKPCAVIFLFACAAWAQQAAPPAFEVASVKVTEQSQGQMAGPGGAVFRFGGGCRKPDPGMVSCTGATLKQLLVQAYGMKAYQIQGPAWIEKDQYDLMAKIPQGVSADQVPAMLQSLLAERFQLTVHKETKTLPALELNVVKGGPKLKEVDPAEVAAAKAAAAEMAARGPGALPPPPPPPPPGSGPGRAGPGGRAMPIGAMAIRISSNGARTFQSKMTMSSLADWLTNQLGRPVYDNTGLKGTYDVELTYLADENDALSSQMRTAMAAAVAAGGGGDAGGGRSQDADTPIATLAQAVQQTLGLKLDAKKAPVETIVVDSGNKVPTEN